MGNQIGAFRRTRAAVIIAIGIVFTVVAHNGYAIGPDGPGDGSAPVSPAATVEDLSVFESVRFLDGFDAQAAVEKAAPTFGDRWLGWDVAGVGTERRLRLFAAPVAPTDRALVDEVAGSFAHDVVVVERPFSLTDLLAYQTKLLDLIEPGSRAEAAATTIGIDTVSDKVIVTLAEHDAEFESAAAAAVPSAAFLVEVSPASVHVVRESYESFPPYKAGKRVKDKSVGTCTSAFDVVNRYSGENYGSFAGHCTFPNDWVWTDYDNRDQIGFSFNDSEDGHNPVPSDSALIALNNQSYGTNKMYVNPGLSRSVRGVIGLSSFASGVPLCARGQTSGVVCGSMTRIEVSVWARGVPVPGGLYTVKRLDHQTCWTGVTRGGDSGGPVYWIPNGGSDPSRAYAVGINSNGSANDSCFDPVYNMLRVNGFLRLRTS